MPTPTYTALATVTLASTDSEIVFSSIPQTMRDLILVINGKLTSTDATEIVFRLNGDTGSNYSTVWMRGNGSSATSSTSSTTYLSQSILIQNANSTSVTQFHDYSATDKHKTMLSRTNAPDFATQAVAGRWANTAAITSITVYPLESKLFAIGLTASLYGIEA